MALSDYNFHNSNRYLLHKLFYCGAALLCANTTARDHPDGTLQALRLGKVEKAI